MVLNNKGQAFFVSLMLAIVVFILALALAGPLKSFTDNARGPNNETNQGLNCDNLPASNDTYNQDFDRANCIATDMFLPYFIGFLIVLGGAVFAARLIFQ